MTGWRISKRCYADPSASAFDGEGSRRRGGRWTPSGKRAAYASSSLSLAALEYFVNLDPEDAPADLVSVRVQIAQGIVFESLDLGLLPDNWRSSPFPLSLQSFGEKWLASASSVCLLVPSAVIPEEWNLIINPSHSKFKDLIFSEAAEFSFDSRMWK